VPEGNGTDHVIFSPAHAALAPLRDEPATKGVREDWETRRVQIVCGALTARSRVHRRTARAFAG